MERDPSHIPPAVSLLFSIIILACTWLASSLKYYGQSAGTALFAEKTSSNTDATTQLELLKFSGNVESNSGPLRNGKKGTKVQCAACTKVLRVNQNGVRCSLCLMFHAKCT